MNSTIFKHLFISEYLVFALTTCKIPHPYTHLTKPKAFIVPGLNVIVRGGLLVW